MRQISNKMKLIISITIMLVVIGIVCFYFNIGFKNNKSQLPLAANSEERNNINSNDTENLATSSLESKIMLSESLNDYYYKDNNDVYFDDKNHGESFKVDNVDLDSFVVSGDKSLYAVDKNNIYFRGVILDGADTKSFKKFKGEKCTNAYSNYSDYYDYYIDKNHIYSGGKILSSNPSTFICLGKGWAKDQDNYYFGSESTSFSYQDNIFYFENIVGERRESGLGGINTNTYVFNKKTGLKKKIFDFGRSGPGGESLPKIAKTNNPNVLEFTYSDGDACEGYQKHWYYNILNNKILKIEFLSSCGFSGNELTINNDILVKEFIDYKGCNSNCQDSCHNLQPIFKDIIVNGLPQKLFSGKEVLRCENHNNWDANSSINYVGINSGLSEVYFTLSNGTWNEKEFKNIISKEYKLSYNLSENKVNLVDSFQDLLILTTVKEPIFY